MTTISELQEWLTGFPDDMDVLLSSDEEGNDYLDLGSYMLGEYDENGNVNSARAKDATLVVLFPE